ncbi:MAG: hypothetical protein IJS55_02075 [Oscillospiraceae bacterium]|nr:hypothetical protein [Oscillospiraceae bacterium]
MTEAIRRCKKCGLCRNQAPLLDEEQNCQIFWVGLSAKKACFDNEPPLSMQTNSGRMIHTIEEMCGDITTYKTNLVKCLPLTEQKKLRYPNKREIDCCYEHLVGEIEAMSPRIVFLLGEKVSAAVERHFALHFPKWQDFSYGYQEYCGVFYVPIHHPSYIYVYKRKRMDDYYSGVKNVVCKLL